MRFLLSKLRIFLFFPTPYLSQPLPIADETIQDMLESHIIKIVRTMFDITKPELAAKARLKLYAINSKQNSLLKKLSEYLESYIGSRDFNILITFKKGVPDLILLV